ncbi:MAG: tRNA (guanosine(46)-N(7))-methyltransferase TrmB [Pseudomonadota bacterium]
MTRPSRSTEAFWGRRRGKPVKQGAAEALSDVLPKWRIDLDKAPLTDLTALFYAPVKSVRLEIGFGAGEHLLNESGLYPDVGFIGVEPFVNSMARFLRDAVDDGRHNIRVYDNDATQLLDWLPDQSLHGIDLFYPDPWPKKRHWKRRFVNEANLDRFARVMKPGALFRYASDIDTYVNWTLQKTDRHSAFQWCAGSPDDWRSAYANWPGTRYEAKAFREGRTPSYLTFKRL